jgi:hypothetical protein
LVSITATVDIEGYIDPLLETEIQIAERLLLPLSAASKFRAMGTRAIG